LLQIYPDKLQTDFQRLEDDDGRRAWTLDGFTRMTTIEIPNVESLASVGDPLENVATVFHFLLTTLLGREQALLHAEYRRPAADTAWYLRPRTREHEGDDETIAVLPSAILQSCAARLAIALEISHIEGGHGHVVLTQEGRQHDCRVFLSNCRESGCWIRVYGRAV
jgi:hypothetical protein